MTHSDDEKLATYQAGTAAYTPPDDAEPPHLAAAEIVNCGLCDDDGYRGHRVCDHVDHSAATKRGMANVRQALADAKAKRGAS